MGDRAIQSTERQPNGALGAVPAQEPDIPLDKLTEWRKASLSPAYFIDTYCRIKDSVRKRWIPFQLWREQYQVLNGWHQHQYNIVLKARQLGLTWMALGYALHGMIFNQHYEVILVSKTQRESHELLSKDRLKGMYKRLPDWMQTAYVDMDNVTRWRLSNGSRALAFPPNNVDTYTANLLIIDEADYPAINLDSLLVSAEPVIDAGGKLILISRGYKDNPESYFKRLYRSAKMGHNEYHPAFLPWHVRPGRSVPWYEKQKEHAMRTDGTLDNVYEKYPATDAEALAARTLDKRIPPEFISRCYDEQSPLGEHEVRQDAPMIPGLKSYRNPRANEVYVIGADPAEGNPNSDDSAAIVLDARTGEEAALLAGKFEVDTFAAHLALLSGYFNNAPVLVERNNHGHAVLLWLRDNARGVKLLKGADGKIGQQTNTRSKSEGYADVVTALRDEDAVIHSFALMSQLQSIEGNTLSAPVGMMDDMAMAFMLAVVARNSRPTMGGGTSNGVGVSGLYSSRSKTTSRRRR